jgi:NTP pyrophosphatase (non-canonical NTP hydrolase)
MTISEFGVKVYGFANHKYSTRELKASYALGLCGESLEAKLALYDTHEDSKEDRRLELGDCLHYGAGLAQLYDVEIDTQIPPLRTSYSIDDLMSLAAIIADMVKKNLYHDKPETAEWREKLAKELSLFVSATLYWGNQCKFTPEDLMQGNINKLVKRFGGEKFNAAYCQSVTA